MTLSSLSTGGATLGRYSLIEPLGRGGMGEVYRARLLGTAGVARDFAVKRLLPVFAQDSELVAMFLDEARLAAHLDHPNIVKIFELGHEASEYFLVMEIVDGYRLRDVLSVLDTADRRLPLGVACFVAREALRGLGYAHEAHAKDGTALRLVHRDVSPENLLLGRTGEVKLCDFGIARAVTRSQQATADNVLKGKCAYMAPEQARGEDLDSRSDLFALGVVLWECLTGRPLFTRKDVMASLYAIQNEETVAPSQLRPGIPSVLDEIVLRATAKDRNARFQSASQMEEALDHILPSLPVTATDERPTASGLAAFVESVFPRNDQARRQRASSRVVEALGASRDSSPSAPDLASGSTVASPARPRRRFRALWGAVGILMVGLGIALVFSRSSTSRPSPVPRVAIAPEPPQTTQPPAPREILKTPPTPIVVPGKQPKSVSRKVRLSAPAKIPASNTGFLDLNSEPWAEVEIDGKRVGRTPLRNIALPAGRHLVRLSNPLRGTERSLEVRVSAGQRVQRFENLEKPKSLSQ